MAADGSQTPTIVAERVRPKAYSYLRFSTPEQALGDSQRRQVAAAVAYAKDNRLDLDSGSAFHDRGVSGFRGANASDGKLAEFLEAVRSGQIDRGSWLLVENLDRLSRMTPRRAARVLEDIVDEGVTVVTMNDRKVYTRENLDGDITTFLLAVLTFMRANEESATKGRRVAAAWANKRATIKPGNAKPYTRLAPAWLRWNDATASWSLIDDRATILQRIFAETIAGRGQATIAKGLNDDRITPWGRAKVWHRSYIKKLQASPAVIGTLIPHSMDHGDPTGPRKGKRKPSGDQVESYYPAAINPDAWNAVASMLPDKGRHQPTMARGRKVWRLRIDNDAGP
jgi:DNA invertase Pin-like site-specific DNA recombinase